MKAFTGVTAVLVTAAVGAVAVALSSQGSWPVWVLVACATALPAIAAINTAMRGRRIDGREGVAWWIMTVAMVVLTPVYIAEYVGAFAIEDILIALTYALGGIAILTVPLPNAGPYQRLVASLDALGLGVVVGTGVFWWVSGSEVDIAGHTIWATSDAAIIAMVGYVAVRRSQRHGIDWALSWVIAGIAAYLGGVLISTVSSTPYSLGHSADFAYFLGMASFALAPLARETRQEPSQLILRPVRWTHVLAPYALVVVLATGLLIHQITTWGHDPAGSILEMGILTATLLVLARQLAMIAEQRHKIELEQSEVIATVSHELRTPPTTVMGFLDLLKDWSNFSDTEKVEMVDVMRNQSYVMARVVEDLISVARQEIDQLHIAMARLPAAELLRSAVKLVPELDESTVRIDIAEGTELTADRERMLQIITNYLSNAAKYGSGQIDIVSFVEADDTVIEVHDNGPGVPDIFHLVIWERFERGPQRQGAIPGSGIGLSVARGIAHSHGGETHYRSSERLGGACFSVRIPRHRPPLQSAVPMTPAIPA